MKNCPLRKLILVDLYFKNKLSMLEIAKRLKVSSHKVVYWMERYKLKRRSWSKATYVKRNPNGDPFSNRSFLLEQNSFIKGLGLGLYWGEGTKADNHSVRLSNSDPFLIKYFLQFLKKIYKINEEKLRFSLHIFSDINPTQALQYWCEELKVGPEKFLKTQVVNLHRKGTYKKKSKYGVITIIFLNKKLRDIINQELTKIKRSCS